MNSREILAENINAEFFFKILEMENNKRDNVAENMQSHEQPVFPICKTTPVEICSLLWVFLLSNKLNMPKLSMSFPV